MKTVWTSSIKDSAVKAELKAAFVASKIVRVRLSEMIDAKIKSSVRSSRAEDAYESPNWALKQADATGYQRALDEIKSLLDEK